MVIHLPASYSKPVEMQCMKLRPYGKNGYMGTKGKHNIMKCKLIVNKHEKIVFMLIGMMLAFLVENCQDAVMTRCREKAETEDFGEESGDI